MASSRGFPWTVLLAAPSARDYGGTLAWRPRSRSFPLYSFVYLSAARSLDSLFARHPRESLDRIAPVPACQVGLMLRVASATCIVYALEPRQTHGCRINRWRQTTRTCRSASAAQPSALLRSVAAPAATAAAPSSRRGLCKPAWPQMLVQHAIPWHYAPVTPLLPTFPVSALLSELPSSRAIERRKGRRAVHGA